MYRVLYAVSLNYVPRGFAYFLKINFNIILIFAALSIKGSHPNTHPHFLPFVFQTRLMLHINITVQFRPYFLLLY